MIKEPWVSAQKAQVIIGDQSFEKDLNIFMKGFVGVREVVTEQNFIFNEETGYYCYMPPNVVPSTVLRELLDEISCFTVN